MKGGCLMLKTLGAFTILSALAVQTALAGDPCGNSAAAGGTPTAKSTPPPAPVQQAQQPQARRSYSYEPSAGVIRNRPRMFGSYSQGVRGATSKVNGNY
jgi:hypothetical protein